MHIKSKHKHTHTEAHTCMGHAHTSMGHAHTKAHTCMGHTHTHTHTHNPILPPPELNRNSNEKITMATTERGA